MNPNKANILINKGFEYLGMIDEARAKCILLKEKIQKIPKNSNIAIFADLDKKIKQINQDLNTYSCKLDKVYEELKSYENVPKLE